ncbi:4'-phosphopantetheinyl transferase superfamily protein [Streptomyces sp. NPDC013178]|uniref:4'-phosphopantetheinyl transferase family protein n=1 Tax=Streptomyces sp. NPDC013178 TaxID=3155118 RepID=UPI0033F3A80B
MTGRHAVPVWWARRADGHAGLLGLLDPVERARYEATADYANRGRFLVGCALSRLALGELLGLPPADVPLRRVCPRCGGPHGKARLAVSQASEHADVDFSVTHSGEVIGVAVCRGAAVGLDVEENAVRLDLDTVAPSALSGAELTALYARPAAERRSAFLRTWTRKEAVLKALGVGLRVPLRGLEVSAPDAPPAVLAWPDQLAERPELAMADMIVGRVHPASAVVVGVSGMRLEQRDASAALAAYGPGR